MVCACRVSRDNLYRGDASRRNKADRRASRQSAAAALAAMSSGGCDAKAGVVLKAASGRRVELGTLAARLAYRELAAVLGSATQGHVAANPLLHEVLGLEDMEVRHCAETDRSRCCGVVRQMQPWPAHSLESHVSFLTGPAFGMCITVCQGNVSSVGLLVPVAAWLPRVYRRPR